MDFQILVPDYLDHLQGFPKQIMQAMALTPDELFNDAWVFLFFSIGLPIWVFMEAKSIIHYTNSERERETNFGNLVKRGVAAKQQARF